MNQIRKKMITKMKLLLVNGLLVLSMMAAGCADHESASSSTAMSKPVIVCTIGMITDVASEVAGDRFVVKGMMGPGVDPHLYKATMRDIKAVNEAQIVFYNGLHLEAKMAEVLEEMSDKKTVVAVTKHIDPAMLTSPPEFEGNYDPHVWFDVSMWSTAVECIRDTLMEADPQHAEEYAQRADAYLVKLNELDHYVKTQVESIPANQRVLVTAHDAFGYFGKRYGFEVKGLQGISTLAEAGVSDVQDIVRFIVDRKIPAIFVESSVPRRNIEAVQEAASKKGWAVSIGGELFSDAMGDAGTEEGTYIGMVRHNINTISAALGATKVNHESATE
jgi:manganese/zinc/iron transport system substrate-binding protein